MLLEKQFSRRFDEVFYHSVNRFFSGCSSRNIDHIARRSSPHAGTKQRRKGCGVDGGLAKLSRAGRADEVRLIVVEHH